MVNIIKQEIEMETSLKNKIKFICSFCNTTPTIYNGSVRTIEHTNISYVELLLFYIKNYIKFLPFTPKNFNPEPD
ncbi:MAG: hypothetical protein J6D28_00120 [Bacilli bacterium]|nr:hypothetical protein [Bacilli bacterium]